MTRTILVAVAALGIAQLSAGCGGGGPPPPPVCVATSTVLTCAATATFCVGGPPDVTGTCPGGTRSDTSYEPTPGSGDTCTECLPGSLGESRPAIDTCDRRLCRACRLATGSGRCIDCVARVVAESTAVCPTSGIVTPPRPRPDAGVDAGVGTDTGVVPTGHFVVQSIEYAGGPTFGPLVAEFEVEETHGEPRVISADELLWVGTSEGYLVGYDVATGEPEHEINLPTLFGTGVSAEVTSLQTYRSTGDLYALVAFGQTLGRIRIGPSSDVAMGHYEMAAAADARIHPLPTLRDEGHVVAVDRLAARLLVIPRIGEGSVAALGDFSSGRVVIPEAAGDGFVWAGRSTTINGDVRTTRVAGATTVVEVARYEFMSGPGGARVDGLTGPEEPATVPSDLVVALTLDGRGQLVTLARESLARLTTGPLLEGPISAFAARAAEAELYVVYAVGASGLGGSELMAVVPTATGLTPRAVRPIDMGDEVLDVALGLEEFREPPEPHVPLPGIVAVVHVLIERP